MNHAPAPPPHRTPPPGYREPAWWERAAAIGLLIMLSGAILGPVFAPSSGGGADSAILRLAWLPAYAAILGLMGMRYEAMARLWFPLLLLLLLALLAYASRYWSLAPDITIRRVIALVMSTFFAVYLAAAWPGRRLPILLTQTALILAVLSLAFVVAVPSIGIHQDVNAGLWRGVWYEKNTMGWVMVAGAVSAAAVLASPGPHKMMAGIAFPFCVLMILGTQSKTALLCLMAACGVIAGLWILRKVGPALAVAGVWTGVVAVAAGVGVLVAAPEFILEALGKDPSLTGRTDIWEAIGRFSDQRPLTGYGYAAFWGAHSDPANYIRIQNQWDVPSAHQGWLEVLIQLGWIGVWAVGAVVVVGVMGSFLRLPVAGRQEGFWAAGYLAAFLLLSLSESVLLRHQDLPWVLFMALLARVFAPLVPPEAVVEPRQGASTFATFSRWEKAEPAHRSAQAIRSWRGG